MTRIAPIPLLLFTLLTCLPAHARRGSRRGEEASPAPGPAANAGEIPALDRLLERTGWQPTPEMTGAFEAGFVFSDTSLGHQIVADDCLDTVPIESSYTSAEMVTNLQSGVQVRVGVGNIGGSAGIVKKVKFGVPVHASIPTLKLHLTDACRTALLQADRSGHLDLTSTYVVKEVLRAEITEQTCGHIDASGSFVSLGQASAELSMACAQHSLEPVAVAFRTIPIRKLLDAQPDLSPLFQSGAPETPQPTAEVPAPP
jgi:hypothetical protein